MRQDAADVTKPFEDPDISFSPQEGLIDSWCKSLSYNGIIRARSNSTPARPYGSLEGFQSVDLSFGLPVAPGLRHSVAHRLQVLAYRLRKTLHRVDPRRARIDQPSVQPLRRSTAKQELCGKLGDGVRRAA